MKLSLFTLAFFGILLPLAATAQEYYKDWDYFRKEIRPGHRGMVTDVERDPVEDSRENCVYTRKLHNPGYGERLEAVRRFDPCAEPVEAAPVMVPAPVAAQPAAPAPQPEATLPKQPDIAVEKSIIAIDKAIDQQRVVTAPLPEPEMKLETIKPIRDSKIIFFDFNKADLTETSKLRLQSIINTLKRASKVDSVKIAGYADKVGKSGSNVKLSERRANAVRDYLKNEGGIDSQLVDLQAKGESVSVTNCPSSLSKAEMVECLQADRRVEIIIEGFEL